MKAKDIMQKHIVGISATTKVSAAAALAESSRVNLIPVLDSGKLIGVVLSSDLDAHRGTDAVAKSITRDPIFVQENDDADEASKIMVREKVSRIPVVKDKRSMICTGMITSTDIIKSAKKKA